MLTLLIALIPERWRKYQARGRADQPRASSTSVTHSPSGTRFRARIRAADTRQAPRSPVPPASLTERRVLPAPAGGASGARAASAAPAGYSPVSGRTARARRKRLSARPAACTHVTNGRDAVEPRILARNAHRLRVDVARQHRTAQRPGGGDGQHAGAGADVENAPRPLRLQQARSSASRQPRVVP